MIKTYFSFIVLFLVLLFLPCGLEGSNDRKTADVRSDVNIVLIVSDDHGMDDLGCYGNSAIQTPNLDALADEGVRFNNAYCTSASCTASRSVILSGLYNHANGLYGHHHHFHHFRAFESIISLPVWKNLAVTGLPGLGNTMSALRMFSGFRRSSRVICEIPWKWQITV